MKVTPGRLRERRFIPHPSPNPSLLRRCFILSAERSGAEEIDVPPVTIVAQLLNPFFLKEKESDFPFSRVLEDSNSFILFNFLRRFVREIFELKFKDSKHQTCCASILHPLKKKKEEIFHQTRNRK